MADQGTSDTFVKVLAGRPVTFKVMGKGQLLMLMRYSSTLQKQMAQAAEADDGAQVDRLLNKLNEAVWTAVESLFVNPEDIDFVQMAIIGGTVQDEELMTVFAGGKNTREPADDEDPPAPKKRAAKKAAPAVAKANPRRAKR